MVIECVIRAIETVFEIISRCASSRTRSAAFSLLRPRAYWPHWPYFMDGGTDTRKVVYGKIGISWQHRL
nr:hypothetical protein Q903MT_gene4642 [Picea sitchensis]